MRLVVVTAVGGLPEKPAHTTRGTSPARVRRSFVCGSCLRVMTKNVYCFAFEMRHFWTIFALSQVKAASLFSAERYAGALPDPWKRPGWTRMSSRKCEIAANLLRSRSVVKRPDGGAATSRTGVKWMLTVGTTVLLTRLNKLLAEAGQTPMSRSTLSALIDGREYAHQTPDLCCCASCRNLGFVGYELLRQIVRGVVPCIVSIPDAARKSLASRLIARIDEEEWFRSGEFLSHLKEEDTTPRHCLGLMCAPFNNLNFKSECEHASHDGARVDAPPTMKQQHPGRAVASDDWFDSCHICSSEDDSNESTEGTMCCNYRKIVAHKSCVAQRSSDLPDLQGESLVVRIMRRSTRRDASRHPLSQVRNARLLGRWFTCGQVTRGKWNGYTPPGLPSCRTWSASSQDGAQWSAYVEVQRWRS